jgi:hypothetical protein
MTIEGTKCTECGIGTYYFNKFCGAFVCDHCDDHYNLAMCFCGWNVKSPEDWAEFEDGYD